MPSKILSRKGYRSRRTFQQTRQQRNGYRQLAAAILLGAFETHQACILALSGNDLAPQRRHHLEAERIAAEHFLALPTIWHELVNREPIDCLARARIQSEEIKADLAEEMTQVGVRLDRAGE